MFNKRGMHGNMSRPAQKSPDRQFAEAMIPHHQSAVQMANWILQNGTDPLLKNMARNIISSQTKEIQILQAWLQRNG